MHTSIVIEAMLVYATQKVRIFTENLAAEVYGRSELLQALEQALRRNIIIEVLTQEQPTNQEFTGIIQKDAGKLSMVKVAQTQYGMNRSENFAVMDMQAFRYVPNKEKLRGFASANDRTSAAILDSNFTRLLLQELQKKNESTYNTTALGELNTIRVQRCRKQNVEDISTG